MYAVHTIIAACTPHLVLLLRLWSATLSFESKWPSSKKRLTITSKPWWNTCDGQHAAVAVSSCHHTGSFLHSEADASNTAGGAAAMVPSTDPALTRAHLLQQGACIFLLVRKDTCASTSYKEAAVAVLLRHGARPCTSFCTIWTSVCDCG
jgi:hypothetical protein